MSQLLLQRIGSWPPFWFIIDLFKQQIYANMYDPIPGFELTTSRARDLLPKPLLQRLICFLIKGYGQCYQMLE